METRFQHQLSPPPAANDGGTGNIINIKFPGRPKPQVVGSGNPMFDFMVGTFIVAGIATAWCISFWIATGSGLIFTSPHEGKE